MPLPDTEALAWLDQIADDFAVRVRAGQLPGIEHYVRLRPDLEQEIREVLGTAGTIESAQRGAARRLDRNEAFPSIANYQIIREIGRGGMGIVYEAEHLGLRRRVALKVLPAHLSRDPKAVSRFRREARAAGKLQHPNIVAIHEVSNDEDTQLYFTMPLVQGISLDRVISQLRHRSRIESEDLLCDRNTHDAENRQSPSSNESKLTVPIQELRSGRESSGRSSSVSSEYFRSVAKIGQQIANAVAYAHEHGILHRDIKPSNILLDSNGNAWVSDFGLAKDLDDEATASGDLVGTIRYMAPERFAGKFDARSDVYGLGLVLYELVSLAPAFDELDRASLIECIRNRPLSEVRFAESCTPRDLNTIIAKATSHAPSDRYSTAVELAEDLHRFLTIQTIKAKSAGPFERIRKWVRRHPSLAGLFFAIAFAALSTSLMWLRSERSRSLEHLARENAERLVYARNIALADSEFRSNRVNRAREILDQCNPEHRNWEWHYLSQQLMPTLWVSKKLDGLVSSVSISRDGRLVAAGCGQWGANAAQTVYVWDIENNRVVCELSDFPECHITSVQISPDGNRLLTAAYVWDSNSSTTNQLGCVKVWNIANGSLVCKVDKVDSKVSRFAPNGESFFVGDSSAKVRRFSSDDGSLIQSYVGSNNMLLDIAFSPDGRWIAGCSRDRTVCIWDVRTSELVFVRNNAADPRQATWSPDGSKFHVLSYEGMMYTYSMQDRAMTLVQQTERAKLSWMSYTPDGLQTIWNRYGAGIEIRDAFRDGLQRTIQSNEGHARSIDLDENGVRMVTGGSDGFIYVWDLTARSAVQRDLKIDGNVFAGMAYEPAGRYFALAMNRKVPKTTIEPMLELRDPDSLKIQKKLIGHTGALTCVAFCGDGSHLLSGSEDKTIRLWNTVESSDASTVGTSIREMPHEDSVTSAIFCEGLAMVSIDQANQIYHWDAAGVLQHSWIASSRPTDVVYLPRDNLVCFALTDGQMLFLNPSNGAIRHRWTWNGRVSAISKSSYGQWLAIGLADSTVEIFALRDVLSSANPEPVQRLIGHTGEIASLSFSPDGSRILSASRDETLRLFDSHLGHELICLDTQKGLTSRVCFRPDGNQIMRIHADNLTTWNIFRPKPSPDERLEDRIAFHQARAAIALREQSFDAAIQNQTALLQLEPDRDQHRRSRAAAFLASGRWREAKEDYKLVMERNASPLDYCFLARAYLMLGEQESYHDTCNKISSEAIRSKSASTLNSLTWSCALSTEPPEGFRDVLKAFENILSRIKNKSRHLYTTLALGYYRQHRFREAIEQVNQAMRDASEINPNNWMILALCSASMDKEFESEALRSSSIPRLLGTILEPVSYYIHKLEEWELNQSRRKLGGVSMESSATQRIHLDLTILRRELHELTSRSTPDNP